MKPLSFSGLVRGFGVASIVLAAACTDDEQVPLPTPAAASGCTAGCSAPASDNDDVSDASTEASPSLSSEQTLPPIEGQEADKNHKEPIHM